MKLPWNKDCRPLMLAPMQGLTNRALRTLFIDRVRPDVVFTEKDPCFAKLMRKLKKTKSLDEFSKLMLGHNPHFPATP